MQSKLDLLKEQADLAEGCDDTVVPQMSMQQAVQAASEHITKGRAHKQAMETMLLQADAHEAALKQVQSAPPTTGSAQTITQMMAKAEREKQASAVHHEQARQQAHLAEGFLSLAAKPHSAAADAALRCKAKQLLAKFGSAGAGSTNNPLKALVADKAQGEAAKA